MGSAVDGSTMLVLVLEKILNREYRQIASDERYLVTTCLFQTVANTCFLIL
jgi:hypothetical protein